MNSVKTEEVPKYGTAPAAPSDAVQRENDVIEYALSILMSRLRQPGETMHNPDTVTQFLKLRMAHLEHEVFACLFLDNRHRVIEYEALFRGTLDGASVHPREVVKAALAHNAAAVILAHNHPSGVPEPSQADLHLTRRLREALGLVDIRVLDHLVIGGMDHVSFAQRGLL